MSEFPSLPEQAKNTTQLIADVIRDALQNNKIFASETEKNRRLSLCMICEQDRKSTRLNSSHVSESRMPSSA